MNAKILGTPTMIEIGKHLMWGQDVYNGMIITVDDINYKVLYSISVQVKGQYVSYVTCVESEVTKKRS